MIVLTLRTDKPETEIGLYNDQTRLDYLTYEAHRQLGVTIHSKIKQLLDKQKLGWQDIGGLVVYKGPGSFTGLRIGLTVANSLSSGLNIPIVGVQSEDDWLDIGPRELLDGKNDQFVQPFYGADPNITVQKK